MDADRLERMARLGRERNGFGEIVKLAEGVGFEPTVGLPLLLISSQVPLTTQPPFQPNVFNAICGY